MDRKYGISVTVGVREIGNGSGGFQASDTFTRTAEGLIDVLTVMGQVSDLMASLQGPQDRPPGRLR